MSTRIDRAIRRARRVSSIVSSAALATAAALALSGRAQAATLYWDDNGAGAGGGGTTAAGTWGSSAFWSLDPNGAAATTGWDVDASNDDVAVFSAGADVTGNYTVTVSGTQTAAGLVFEESGTATVTTGVTLSGGVITLNAPIPTISIGTATGDRNVRINSTISAANEVLITKATSGEATLQLGAANTFAGGLRIDRAVRVNANADGALGAGTGDITVTASGAAISSQNSTTLTAASVTVGKNIVLNLAPGENFTLGSARSNGAVTYSGNISGTGDLIFTADPYSQNSNGNGVTYLSGANTYNGSTIVNVDETSGVVRLGSPGALSSGPGGLGTPLILGRGNQQIGDVDLNGQDITIASLSSNLPAVAVGGASHGITNSNGAAGGSITVTGSAATTFARPIGDLPTVSNANLPTKSTNLSLTLAASHTGNLTLTDVSNYAGPTNINGGTLTVANAGNTIAGAINVNSGGRLGSRAGTKATISGVAGAVNVASGGEVMPGGQGGSGTLRIDGGLTLNGTPATPGAADLTFDLFSPSNHDFLNLGSSALTLNNTNTVNINGIASAGLIGTYTLATYGSIAGAGSIVKGTDPGGDFTYTLTPGATAMTLQILPVNATLLWDADNAGTPVADGAGNWSDGSPNFVDLAASPNPVQANYNNGASADVIFGGGAEPSTFGGIITLTGSVRTGGKLIFGAIDATAPYTIGDGTTTNTLTTVGGVVANSSATINAPVVLEASQEFKTASGATLTVLGNITDGPGGPAAITKTGGGILVLSGTGNTFSGGLIINESAVQVDNAGAVGSGTITLNGNGQFRFLNSFAITNNFVVNPGTGSIYASTDAASLPISAGISGNITGTGKLTKHGSGSIALTGTNTFSGGLLIDNGTIYVNSDAALGTGDIEINSGGLGAVGSSWSTSKNILMSGSHFNEDFRTNGFDITLNGVLSGDGDLFKHDAGTLVLNGANTYTGNTIINSSNLPAGAGTIRTNSPSALGTGNLQVQAPLTLDVASDLVTGAIRGASTLTKTGAGTLFLSGTTTTANLNGSIVVNEGKVQLDGRDALGGVNPASGAATSGQLAIVLNSGTELLSNWGSGTPRRGTSITLNNATIRRLATAPGEDIYSAYNGDAYYGGVLTISGNSKIHNEQISNGSGVNNLGFDMPVVLQAGATLTMQNDNDAGDFDAYNTSLRGVNNTLHSAYDILTMNDGSSIVTIGPGEKRIGGITTGKPIVVNGNAALKLDRRTFINDIDGTGTGNEFTKLTINGGGLRIEAAMNASYTTPIDPQPVQQPEEGFTGLFGINTTTSAEGGTQPAGYDVIGNAYTVFSPKRAAGLSGSTGTITLAATDATDATGRIEYGPSAATNLRLKLDNTAASAGANLVYEIDAQANGGTFGNFAGLDVASSNTGAGSVKAKIVNAPVRIGSVSIAAGTSIDITDQKLILDNQPGGAGTATEGTYNGLQGQVQSAYNFGSWNGPGLTTSMQLALDGIATVGVATGEQIRGLGPTDTDVWAGHTINGASTLAMYTYAGDANLDGQVDAGDYGILDAFIQVEGATGYGNGDFNYDGFIDAADYGTIDNSIQFQGPPFPTSGTASSARLSGVTAVPEPASLSIVGLAAATLLGRRRRRH